VGNSLVVRTDKIGDLLLSLPVAEAIKEACPDARVTYLVSPATAELAGACPFVDAVLRYDETRPGPRPLFEIASVIGRTRPDVALFLRPTLRTALGAALAGVPVRVGTSYRYYSGLFTRRVREHRSVAARHEIQYNLSLLEALVPLEDRARLPRIRLPEGSRAYAQQALRERNLQPGPFVVVHPGSARSARNLPAAAYAELADAVESNFGIRVLLTAGSEEAGLVELIRGRMRTVPAVLAGAPGLLDLAAVISQACAFVSGSTGPMHLAGAVGTPTVSFFSPVRSCSPRRWQPVGERKRVILPPVPECPTCVGEKCPYYDCMERIEPEAILDALGQMLQTCR